MCIALLPAAAVKKSSTTHSASVALEPTVDTIKFDILSQVGLHQDLLRKTSNALFHPVRNIPDFGVAWLDTCATDCMSEQYGSTSILLNCWPQSELDTQIENFMEASRKCAQTCNTADIKDFGEICLRSAPDEY